MVRSQQEWVKVQSDTPPVEETEMESFPARTAGEPTELEPGSRLLLPSPVLRLPPPPHCPPGEARLHRGLMSNMLVKRVTLKCHNFCPWKDKRAELSWGTSPPPCSNETPGWALGGHISPLCQPGASCADVSDILAAWAEPSAPAFSGYFLTRGTWSCCFLNSIHQHLVR